MVKKGQHYVLPVIWLPPMWVAFGKLIICCFSKDYGVLCIHIFVYYVQMRQKNGGNFSRCLGGTKGFLLTSQGNICSSEIFLSLNWIMNVTILNEYHTRAIITRGLYSFYPPFEVHLCTTTFCLMYGYYSRAVSNWDRVIVVRVRYILHRSHLHNV